ncbi:MAG TPA: exodeoxyribonuclease VII large subunit, partial [Gemmatales bacterium]|nr:exodeoxyribonuclease VII large subunit [Gemmatales bacterium]
MPGLFDHLPDAEPGRRAPRPSAPTAAPPSVPVDSPLPSAEPAAEKPLSVSQLTARIKALLETRFAQVFVDGEISRPTLHASGHVYFTLKDSQTQINAILWRNSAKAVRFKLTHGLQVQVRGRIEVYPARGQYQLIVDRIEPLGLGPLELAFQQLKEELQRRGWFDPQRKRPLPLYPRRIALVTSEGSAALQDMLRQLLGRWPLAEVWLVPVPVQGEGAARAIAQGIDLVGQVEPTADLLLVGRGGGSLEDLWAFNEEVVAAAILRAPMPVISAVGHETDFTISDH